MDFTLKSFEQGNTDEILQHAKMLHEVCCLIYANPNVYDEEKKLWNMQNENFLIMYYEEATINLQFTDLISETTI